MDTEHYRYCLRCTPVSGDYQGYLYCYDKRQQELGRQDKVVGQVSYADGTTQAFTDPRQYLQTIREELPFRNATGFRYETLTADPQVRKEVDDIILDFAGEENPRRACGYGLTEKGLQALRDAADPALPHTYAWFVLTDCNTPQEQIHQGLTLDEAIRLYLDPETVGAAYRESGAGCYVGEHYVERLSPDRPLPDVEPLGTQPPAGSYAIRIKLASRNNMEGVWVGFPDTAEYMDPALPGELLLGLKALNAETLDQCIAVDVDCALPQITDILTQYDSAHALVRHAIDFGYVWAEQGQGEPYWMEKWQTVMELEDCHRLDLALDLAQNLHCYEFLPRGVDLAQYGMELARKDGILGHDQLLDRCFDSVSYAQHHMAKYGLSAADHGYAARNGQEILYEYSQPDRGPEMAM